MQEPGGHPPRHFTVNIAHPVPRVVSAVEPDGDPPARLQQSGQHLESSFTIRRVVKNTDAVNEIKTFGCERKVEYISLKNRGVTSGQILCCHLRRQAKINAHDVRSPASGNLRETPHPASHVEHQLSSKTLGAK